MFDHNGQPNRHAYHDVGLAVGNLVVQATACGLSVHQMGGILPEKVKTLYRLPDGHEDIAGIAIGYAGDPSTLPDALRERELAQRTRKSWEDFVFSRSWGQPATICHANS